jgi:TnpA family transposase
MTVNFLTSEYQEKYGKYSGEPDKAQLEQYFYLDKTDLEFISNCRGDQNRFGVALQLTSIRFLGVSLLDLKSVPANVQIFVAQQIKINDINILSDYAKRDITRHDHITLICKHYGYNNFNDPPWSFRLIRLLYSRSWLSDERPSLMFDFALSWLNHNKILLPGISTLMRLISKIRERTSNRLWKCLSSYPSDEQKSELETLFEIPDDKRISKFDNYRKGPVVISSLAFNNAVERHLELKAFGMQKLNFSYIPPIHLKNLARHAGIISMHKIARMPYDKRIAILVAFVKTFETIALDEALDVLDLLITDIAGQAKKIGQKRRLRTLKDLDKSALKLAEVCLFLLNDGAEDTNLRKSIFSQFSRQEVVNSVSTVNNIARPSDNNFYYEMVEQYGKVRRFLPHLLNHINFKSAPAGKIIIKVLDYLTPIIASHKNRQILENPPLNIITKAWKKLIFDKDGKVTKRGYLLCFLEKLQDGLRRRDIYVENSDRWNDSRLKLLQGADWEINKTRLCRLLGHPVKADDAFTNLTLLLDATYKRVADNFDKNDLVNLDNSDKITSLTITNLNKLEEPNSLIFLREKVNGLLPKIDLTELILEIDAHTGFSGEFTHISESRARVDDLKTSVCAVLLAEACNIGLEPVIKHHIPALTRHRLGWTNQNYIRAETIIKGNARLVDYQSALPLVKRWGNGEVASADGMRFVTPVKTINARANRKYFNSKKGITWYNFMSDQFAGFHGIVVPGTLRDSIFILEGILEQQTGLNPTEIMTDTSGVSNLVFGLFWLLGYQFSPRLADAGEAVFWRINKEANYGALNDLARGIIDPNKIIQHWDDMMRTAGSLKLGTIHASELIKTLLKSDRPSGLAQAIIEVGRINKTLYLLNYIDDEDYRRRILTQLNRTEGRHSVARIICHGQRGEIRKRYREGQEDQLGALGLVTNAVVLWNTIYMQKALDHLRQQNFEINPEDEARLSPLPHGHINVLGNYSFKLQDMVGNGFLRPLNIV